jgi:hypothetical protein
MMRLLCNKFPKYKLIYLNEINQICLFNIKDGGRYMQNNALTTRQKLDLTILLTEFVALPTAINNKESKFYNVIPNIIHRFAEGCCVGTVCRLCKRAVWHAVDPKAIDIQTCTCGIFEDNN